MNIERRILKSLCPAFFIKRHAGGVPQFDVERSMFDVGRSSFSLDLIFILPAYVD
jgi:hypothetical protein